MSVLKDFNTYLASIDSDFWKDLLMDGGILRSYEKGEEFISEGMTARYLGLIKSGSVKYVAYTSDHEEKIVGLETVGGYAASWPYCLHDLPSPVSVIVNSPSEIYCISVTKLKEMALNDAEFKKQISHSTEQVFYTAYQRLISLYCQSPKERYTELLENCPKIFEVFDLKDVASFLNITPQHLCRLKKC